MKEGKCGDDLPAFMLGMCPILIPPLPILVPCPDTMSHSYSSLHSSGVESQELKELQDMLRSDISASEKM